jgi:phosphatidylinositol alpha-1,6-mannosyltransferase
VNHLLVTNDFPPKIGGIQSYLWELWRRLPPEQTTVLTTAYEGAESFDRQQPFRVERVEQKVMLPSRRLIERVDRLADAVDADLVLLDPALPVGAIGPRLDRPYGVVLHGAEVTVPARTPLAAGRLRDVLLGARLIVSAGGYPANEAERCARKALPIVQVPPGVDVDTFRPLDADQRARARRRFGVAPDAPLVVSVSRLVPRKGMDVLIRAGVALRRSFPDLEVLIAGAGRDRRRLERLVARSRAPVRFLGRVDADDLPPLHGCADVFAMICRDRWAGLEQEGFGIVFLEAAACRVPQVAGRSGGSHEAVVDGRTGFVVDEPTSPDAVVAAISRLLTDPERRRRMGGASRARAEAEFTYERLAATLHRAIQAVECQP